MIQCPIALPSGQSKIKRSRLTIFPRATASVLTVFSFPGSVE
ncbi:MULTISPECIES: hypothetical protein [Fischerella]|nr:MULTISPECIES: hypothetical protein [Fischerella]